LLPQSKEDVPLATIGSRFALAEPAREQILQHMISSLGSPALAQAAESIDERSWSQHELTDLETEWQSWGAEPFVAREDTLGVLVMARHTAEPLSEEESNMLGVLVSQATTALDNVHLFQRMRDLATRDRLTGLYNHGHFFELLEAEISRAERHATELAVIMLDIDRKSGLKSVNDTYGHQAGDRLLREFGLSLKASLRRADVVARYGGDEFVVLAPQTTRRSAIALAERICERVRNTAFAVSDGHTAQITVSGGVTVFYPGTGLAAADIVGLADRATYQAKDLGGDQICIVDAPYSA